MTTKNTLSAANKHKNNTEDLYAKCRMGHGKDIKGSHDSFMKSYEKMESALQNEEESELTKLQSKKKEN